MKKFLISLVIALSIVCFAFSSVEPYESMLTSSVSIFVDGRPAGSGVIIDDNVIATAAHVLRFTEKYKGCQVTFQIRQYDGTITDCSYYVYDTKHDVGLLFVDIEEESIAELSTITKVGNKIFIVGNPFGDLEFSLTDGIVSHMSRPFAQHGDLLQVTAPVASGSSGGPLYDEHGKVLGVITGSRRISGFTAVSKAEYIKEFYERYKPELGRK